MTSFEKFAMEIKNKHAKPGCWYLYVFETMAEFRGKGLGSKIMKPMLNYLDEHNQDCYLETHKEENVKIYEHYGFELLEISKIPETDVVQYSMLRKVKQNKD